MASVRFALNVVVRGNVRNQPPRNMPLAQTAVSLLTVFRNKRPSYNSD